MTRSQVRAHWIELPLILTEALVANASEPRDICLSDTFANPQGVHINCEYCKTEYAPLGDLAGALYSSDQLPRLLLHVDPLALVVALLEGAGNRVFDVGGVLHHGGDVSPRVAAL